jgi:CheY-like chemotaxis protein
MPADPPIDVYEVACYGCGRTFDAVAAPWCGCLVSERTPACPHCGACSCSAPDAYKRKLWSGAPRALWDRKFAEHHREDGGGTEDVPEKRPLILVVDDEADIRRVAVAALRDLGYGVVVATNGAAGIEAARRHRPDLVLSDALMPNMDGREMCRRLKTDPETASIPVIVMTSLFTSVKYRNEAHNTFKVDGYLSKPLSRASLEEAVARHLPQPVP